MHNASAAIAVNICAARSEVFGIASVLSAQESKIVISAEPAAGNALGNKRLAPRVNLKSKPSTNSNPLKTKGY
jgi:hypothetical protein